MKGLAETLARIGGRLFRRSETREYPDEPVPLAPRFRGRLVLSLDPDGRERCVACNLCSAVCPVDCIDLQKAETEDGRWYPEWFRVNLGRCIFCGLCEEACPTCAIQLVPDFELSEWHRDAMVWEKEHLTISGPGKYPGYRYWQQSGKSVEGKDKGEGDQDGRVADPRKLTP
ncbi:MAG: NADH-quinone oxidoreductase subunit NuoI [Paracoccaceae bacterium]